MIRRKFVTQQSHHIGIQVLSRVFQIGCIESLVAANFGPVLDQGIDVTGFLTVGPVRGPLFGRIDNVPEGLVAIHLSTRTLADRPRDELRMEYDILKADHEPRKRCPDVVSVPVTPKFQQTVVMLIERRVLDRDIDGRPTFFCKSSKIMVVVMVLVVLVLVHHELSIHGIGHKIGTVIGMVRPLGPVRVSAHALRPLERIAHRHGGEHVAGVQGGIIVRAMVQPKFFVPHGGVLAPEHLPAHAARQFAVLAYARGHVTIGNQELRHEIGAGVETPRRADEMFGGIHPRILKGLTGFQSEHDGISTVECHHVLNGRDAFQNFWIHLVRAHGFFQ